MKEQNLNNIVENFLSDTLSKFKTWGSAVKGAVTKKVNPMTGEEKIKKLSGNAAIQAANKIFTANQEIASHQGNLIAGDHDTNYNVPAFIRRASAKDAANAQLDGTPAATGWKEPAKNSKYYKEEPKASKSNLTVTTSEREAYSAMSPAEKKAFLSKNLTAQGRRAYLRDKTYRSTQE